MSAVDVSIVVCTYNRATMLGRALESLAAQTVPGSCRLEIVVVDNGSTDSTPEVVACWAARSPVPLVAVREPRPGVAAARNAGIGAAQGDWIAFFDDDQVAEPDWLRELLAAADTFGTSCVGGPCYPVLPPDCEPHMAVAYRDLLEQTETRGGDCRYEGKMTPGTGNLLLHRSVFQRVGRFDESLHAAGEDTDFYRRMRAAGIEAWYASRAIVWHVVAPGRLEERSLFWAQRRTGWVFAHRDRKTWGRLGLLALTAARAGQAAGLRVPQLVWAWARRDRGAALRVRCDLARAVGYVRGALHWTAPALFAQRSFSAHVEFRSERREGPDAGVAAPHAEPGGPA